MRLLRASGKKIILSDVQSAFSVISGETAMDVAFNAYQAYSELHELSDAPEGTISKPALEFVEERMDDLWYNFGSALAP